MRLIDADELIKYIQKSYCYQCEKAGMDHGGLHCDICHVGNSLNDIDDYADNAGDQQ